MFAGFALSFQTRTLDAVGGPGTLQKGEIVLQKLFSAFPDGWPGLGLLLLRGLVGLTLISQGISYVSAPGLTLLDWLVVALAVVTGICLLAGFMTPIVAGVAGLVCLGFPLSDHVVTTQYPFDLRIIVNLIVVTFAIACLGPGAFSLDARMFGRREIRIPQSLNPPNSEHSKREVC